MTAGDADLPEALAQPAWTSPQPTAAEPRRVETRIAVLGKETHKGLGAAAEPAEPAESESLILGTAIPKRDTAVKRVELAAAAPVPAAPVPPAAPVIAVKADLPPDVAQSPAPPAKTPAPGSSYVIIASYYRAEDAARFSKRNAKWKPQVLEGRAKDRQVFRVAVGPLARMTAGKQAKQFRKEGFKGAWRLTLEKPIVETEMAALR